MITHSCQADPNVYIDSDSDSDSGVIVFAKKDNFVIMEKNDCIGFIHTKASCCVDNENLFNIMGNEQDVSWLLKQQLKQSLCDDNAKTEKVIFIERFEIFPDFQGQGNGKKVFELLK